MSTVTGAWVQIEVPNVSTPVSEVTVYANSTGGAEYLVDSVRVNATG